MSREMPEFKTADFVQVKWEECTSSGEPILFWRNALYNHNEDEKHNVIYVDGSKHCICDDTLIRKAQLQEKDQ